MTRNHPLPSILLSMIMGVFAGIHTGEPTHKPGTTDFYLKLALTVFLVLLGGLFAGLTLGLMSLDETNLHILAISGNDKQKKYVAQIQPIRKNGHLLLVTLLLSNTLINETLPIIMDEIIGGGLIAILVSTALIVIFGEVLPQSICSRHGLAVGAFFAWPVRIFIWLTFPLSYPIAKLLDKLLGKEKGMIYRRAELRELIEYHGTLTAHGGDLITDTVTIMRGALDLQEKTVEMAMTPIEKAFMISWDTKLDRHALQEIVTAGHSRIPVYNKTRDKIVGVLLTKSLILYSPDEELPLRSCTITHIPTVEAGMPLLDMLNSFQEGSSHIAVVVKTEKSQQIPIGIITLEDVLEELIQEEIYDETDRRVRLLESASHIISANKIQRASINDPTPSGEAVGKTKGIFKSRVIRSNTLPLSTSSSQLKDLHDDTPEQKDAVLIVLDD